MTKIIPTIGKGLFITLFWLSATNAYAQCSTAKDDIAKLEHEKHDTDDRIAKGVFAVLPIGLVLNTAQKAGETEQEKMDAKEYEKQIDERIAEIKKECGLE